MPERKEEAATSPEVESGRLQSDDAHIDCPDKPGVPESEDETTDSGGWLKILSETSFTPKCCDFQSPFAKGRR